MDCRIWPPAVANPYNDEEAVGTMDQLNNDTGPKHRATGYLSGDLGNWISQVSWEWPLGSQQTLLRVTPINAMHF